MERIETLTDYTTDRTRGQTQTDTQTQVVQETERDSERTRGKQTCTHRDDVLECREDIEKYHIF